MENIQKQRSHAHKYSYWPVKRKIKAEKNGQRENHFLELKSVLGEMTIEISAMTTHMYKCLAIKTTNWTEFPLV